MLPSTSAEGLPECWEKKIGKSYLVNAKSVILTAVQVPLGDY